MAILNCTMCGGHLEMTADRSIGICECCGSAITFPKVDDDQLAAAFNRGNHFRRMGEFDKALAVYERIVQQDDTEAEAHWCCALCRFGIEYVEDPASLEWIPTCHRASFDSFLEDVDYLAALKHSTGAKRIQYQKYAAKIAEVQRGILATSQNAEPFDVFICYKETDEQGQRTRDSLLAQDIYYQLTEQGRRVFFARITLEDVAGTQYEPYIFAALNSAKVMVVVGTKPEHLSAVWVKNEWSRFLALMRKDHSRLLLPCYRDMDPYDLPEQLSVLQSYDMSKIGFIQDLIRGISKVLDTEKKPEPARETVVMQSNSNVAALLKRGNMALEDGDWEKADSFYEEVLNQDPECAEAYVGKTLSEEKCRSLDAFVEKRLSLYKDAIPQGLSIKSDPSHAKQLIAQYTIPSYFDHNTVDDLLSFDLTYTSDVESRNQQLQSEQAYWVSHKLLTRATQFAKNDFAIQLNAAKDKLFSTLKDHISQAKAEEASAIEALRNNYRIHIENAYKSAEKLYRKSCDRREVDYNNWVAAMDTADTEEAFFRLCKSFTSLEGYRDSALHIQKCEERIKEFKEKAKADQEARYKQQAKERKKTIVIVVCLLIALIIGCVGVVHITKIIQYNSAVQLAEDGKYQKAIQTFRKLKSFKDSESKVSELWRDVTSKETLSAGNTISVSLKNDGTVLATGYNLSGSIETIRSWNDIIAISASEGHIAALTSKGTVRIAGYTNLSHMNAVASSEWKDIVGIATGRNCTVGIKSDGTLVSHGFSYSESFDDWEDITAVAIAPHHIIGLKLDGTVVTAGSTAFGQEEVTDWKDIIAIDVNQSYSFGLKANGTVVSTNSPLDTSTWTDITAISAGNGFIVGLRSDGTVVATGDNSYGQCNVQDWTDIVAISAGEQHTLGLKSDGTVVFAGRNVEKQGEVSDWKDVKTPD